MKYKFVVGCLLVVFVLGSMPAIAAKAEDYARLPTFTDIEVAPGGRYFAARYNNDNTYYFMVFNIENGGLETVYSFAENDEVSVTWFEWVSTDRLLTSVAFTSKRLVRGVVKTEERRLLAVNASTAEVYSLFRGGRDDVPVQIQDRVISFLPNDPSRILLQYRPSLSDPLGVYSVDVTKTARHRRVQGGRSDVYDWITDIDGEVRIATGVGKGQRPNLKIRLKGEKKWHDYSHRLQDENTSFRVIGFTAEPNELYVASNHEGDPIGLYTFDIATDTFGALIYQHDSVDIRSVNIDDATGELFSVNFVEDYVETVRFKEPPLDEEIDRIDEKYPDKTLYVHSISRDNEQAILRISGPRDAGRYFVYSNPTKRLMQLPAQYPTVSEDLLGDTFAVDYEARDGLNIPAYITLPSNYRSLDEIKNLPFVIRPHGGPGARDFLRFDYSVQFLTSLGYGVLQMNFRGSTGYGQAFKDAGDRQWGQAMQDDVTDGVHWLIENEYADPDRIAIAGGSYGGYVALMGAVKTPDLYQCAVSFAGVSDLPDLLRHQRNFVAGKYATRFIGDLWRDRRMLATNSPARRAEEIKVPILLMHGDLDTVVKIDQSKKMAKQLKKYDKEYSYIVFEDGDHYRSLYRNRLQYLQETQEFLADCLQ